MSKFVRGMWVKHADLGIGKVLHNRKLSRMVLVRFLNGSALNDYRHRFEPLTKEQLAIEIAKQAMNIKGD